MTIQDTQERLVRNRILKEELQKGRYPTVQLIEDLLKEVFKEKPSGIPRFTLRPAVKETASNANEYNAMFSEIGEDLEVGFEEIRYLNNKLMALGNYYESNRIMLDRELKRIELKAQAILNQSQSPLNVDVIGDTFNDFSMVEFEPDNLRNIPDTTAFVNLKHGEVILNELKNNTFKHNILDASIYFKTTDSNLTVMNLSSFKNALQDNIQEAWRSIVISKEAKTVKANLEIQLSSKILATTISINAQAGKPSYITLSLSADGVEYTEYERRKVASTYQWTFERTEFQYIRFTFEKEEEDRQNGSEFEYFFGAKHIEVKEERYLDEGILVSKPFGLKFHEAIKQIHLEVDEYLPSNSNIKYFVGLDYGRNIIEWQEISKTKPTSMRMVETISTEINQNTEGYGELMYQAFNQNYYRIAHLPRRPLRKSTELFVGRGMWVKETITTPFTFVSDFERMEFTPFQDTPTDDTLVLKDNRGYVVDINPDKETIDIRLYGELTTLHVAPEVIDQILINDLILFDYFERYDKDTNTYLKMICYLKRRLMSPVYQTSIKDWVRVGSAKKEYIHIQNTVDVLAPNHFHRYTTYINMNEEKTLLNTIRSSIDASCSVMLNGSRIKGINGLFEMPLRKGWNKVEIYAYAREVDQEIVMQFDVPNLGNLIFSNRQPLKEISLYDMLHNTNTRDHNNFAIDDDNNIIVNYHPKLIDIKDENGMKTSMESTGVEYLLTYDYSISSEINHRLRFMAILSKEIESLKTSPKLKSYKLTIE